MSSAPMEANIPVMKPEAHKCGLKEKRVYVRLHKGYVCMYMTQLLKDIAHVRLRRELKGEEVWMSDEDPADRSFVIRLRGIRLRIPHSYPFDPPHMIDACHVRSSFDAERWCIVNLIDPVGLKGMYPSWKIACTCCNSTTCARNWNVWCSVLKVINEVRFLDFYARLEGVTFPVILCDDILKHLVDVAHRK